MNHIKPFLLDDLDKVATELITLCTPYTIWLFDGQMGAGKTTLIREICKQLGVIDNVQSPTFSIVNEYITIDNNLIYHFDCYRLRNEIEAFDIGIEEYLDSGNLCLIEWYQKIASFLPSTYAQINIKEVENNKREIIINLNTQP